ncbi:MAG: hypothetical protein IKK51_03700 [Oscillospiraceae bacterium]|nr:hypothetical protein [Oscillospiraceae bacterium]
MEKRKSAPIWGLFYRELYPTLKEVILCYVLGIVLCIVFYLIKLSMEIGNLADMNGDDLSMLKMMLPGYAIYLPGILFMAEVNGSLSAFQFEMQPKFRCFTASIPVSEWKFVGVKFLTSASILVVGILAAILNAAIMCSVFDTAFDQTIIANLMLCAVGLSIVCAGLYLFNYLFRNPMVAIITALVILYAAVIIWMVPHFDLIEQLSTENETNAMSIILDKITGFSAAFLPFSVPCIIGSLGLGWVLCALLAKRREK